MKRSLLIIFLLLVWWLGGFLIFLNNIPAKPSQLSSVDAVVILTGGSGRVLEGVNLILQNVAQKMLITGVAKKTTITEILLLIKDLPKSNLEFLKERITLGYQANNTIGNADETALWMKQNGYKSLVMVTSNYHIPRSLLEFRVKMPDVAIDIAPVSNNIDTKQWWQNIEHANLLFLEYNKYLATILSYILDR